MAQHLIFSGEGKSTKIETQQESGRLGQGLYFFPWNEPESTYAEKSSPNVEFSTSDQTRKTPRVVRTTFDGQKICVATNLHFQCLPSSMVTEKNQSVLLNEDDKMISFFSLSGVTTEKAFREMIDDSRTGMWIEPTQQGTFLALYNYDNLKLDTKVNDQKKGYLFYSPAPEETLFQLLPFPATGMIKVNGSTALVACGSTLENLIYEQGNWIQSKPLHMKGNILAVSSLADLTVATDNKEGYIISYKGIDSGEQFQKHPDFRYFRDNTDRLYLPSEATSVLVTSLPEAGEKKYYVIFGVDDAKLLIYEANLPSLHLKYLRTVQVLSAKSIIEEAEKDNHIWQLQQASTDQIHLTIRNLYVRMNLKQLLTTSKSIIDIESFDSSSPIPHEYGLDRICKIPHRINRFDII